MQIPVELAALEVLKLSEGEQIYYGGDQDWYTSVWQQRAGCGPTTASLLMLYLAKTRPGAQALCPHAQTKTGFLELMQQVWYHITPGRMGVNKAAMFTTGAVRYGAEHGLQIETETLHIPHDKRKRPNAEEMCAFMVRAMEHNRPVAFLNLSNGTLENLDNWHWVALCGFDAGTMCATMYDAGKKTVIELGRWLASTVRGGALVTLDVNCAQQQTREVPCLDGRSA